MQLEKTKRSLSESDARAVRAVLLSNGRRGPAPFYADLIDPEDFLVCADGGANHAHALGLRPDLVVGDMDSIDQSVRRELEAQGKTAFDSFPVEKDASDTELALAATLERNPAEILMTCVLGDRFDHSLANVGLLASVPEWVPCEIAEPGIRVRLVRDRARLEEPPGCLVSIMPFGGDAGGVTLSGFKYLLHNENLLQRATRGLSNVTTGEAADVSVEWGMILVMIVDRNGPGV